LRFFQRAAEDDKATLVDGTMNANAATKPGMMPIKNPAKNGPVCVLKPCCTTNLERTCRWTKMRHSRVRFRSPAALLPALFLEDCIINIAGFEFSAGTGVDRCDLPEGSAGTFDASGDQGNKA
jgi:hypothetical protein